MSTVTANERETGGRYSTAETAYIFNWNDNCLIKGLSFRGTITGKFLSTFGRTRQYKSILDRLRTFLRYTLHDDGLKYVHVLRKGTRCIPDALFTEEWRAELNKGRHQLGLPPLGHGYNIHPEMENSETPDSTRNSSNTDSTPGIMPMEELRKMDPSCEQNNTRNRKPIQQSRPSAACHTCAQKKIKCIKVANSNQCNTCQKAGKKCVPRTLSMSLKRKKGHYKRSPTRAKRTRLTDHSSMEASISAPLMEIKDHIEEPQRGTIDVVPSASMIGTINPETFLPGQRTRLPNVEVVTTPKNQINGSHDGEEKERNRLLSSILFDLIDRLESRKQVTQEEVERLRSISRTIQHEEPVQVLQILRDDLVAAEKNFIRLRHMANALIGGQSFLDRVIFPIDPSSELIDREWQNVREAVLFATGNEYSGRLPPPETLGYFASSVDNLLTGRFSEENLVKWFTETISRHLENRCVLQTLLSALLCRWVFAELSFLFDGQHSGIASKMYSMIDMNDGLQAVRNTDLRLTKLLIEDKVFQDENIPRAATSFVNRLITLLRPDIRSEVGLSQDDFYQLCERAIRFKLMLMTSSMDYRVFFCPPGKKYDRTWMDAEDDEGVPLRPEVCESKKVRLCLFPAIAQYQSDLSDLDPDDITTAFACNKPFSLQPNIGEAVNPEEVVSKAIVIME